ncbi:MAG: hypothetical protein ACKVVP_07485 [Chloroflexota bacterium]
MPTFQRGFEDAERSAVAAARAAGSVATAAKQMQKAAQEGDINRLRRTTERIVAALDTARQEVANAKAAWPFTEEQEKEYFRDSYEGELVEEAARVGLTIQSRDARLVAYPSIIQILTGELAVRIDRKRVTAIRPSHLVETLVANQTKKVGYSSERFIEALYRAYQMISGPDGGGAPVLLARIYRAFTLRPGAGADYDKSDFARDLYMLDHSNPAITCTSSGARLTWQTSVRGDTNVFTFVSPTGELMKYYSVQFTEG